VPALWKCLLDVLSCHPRRFGVFLPLWCVDDLARQPVYVERIIHWANPVVFGLGSGVAFLRCRWSLLWPIRARLSYADLPEGLPCAGLGIAVIMTRPECHSALRVLPGAATPMSEIILVSFDICVSCVEPLPLDSSSVRRGFGAQGSIRRAVTRRCTSRPKRGGKLLDVPTQRRHSYSPRVRAGRAPAVVRVTRTGEGLGEAQATERGVLSPKERRAPCGVLPAKATLRAICAVQVPADDIISAGGGVTCTRGSTRMLAPLIREIVLDLAR